VIYFFIINLVMWQHVVRYMWVGRCLNKVCSLRMILWSKHVEAF